MGIEKNLVQLRTQIRKSSQKITNFISVHYISLNKETEKQEICMFCGTNNNLSKEHVLPKWVFEWCSKKFFITTINNSEQTYNKTTVKACKCCNSEILSSLERYIKNLFEGSTDIAFDFNEEEIGNIICWLEIIEYKFQILDMQRKFLKYSRSEFIPYLRNFPIAIMASENSPSKILTLFRKTLKNISIKDKTSKINSLVLFKTKNQWFHFFHKTNDFIFLELPKYKIALFYFFNKNFPTNKEAYEEAIKVIEKQYSS